MYFIGLDEQPKEDILRQLILGGRQRGKRYKLKELTKRGNKMNFIEAYTAITEGKKVRRVDWDESSYIYREVGCFCPKLQLCVKDECEVSYGFKRSDYLNNWEIYEEKKKLHTFEEALAAFKNGKRISRVTRIFWLSLENKSKLAPEYRIIEADELLANDWIIEGK